MSRGPWTVLCRRLSARATDLEELIRSSISLRALRPARGNAPLQEELNFVRERARDMQRDLEGAATPTSTTLRLFNLTIIHVVRIIKTEAKGNHDWRDCLLVVTLSPALPYNSNTMAQSLSALQLMTRKSLVVPY